ncbi:hypothetical protein Golax_018084 [Gossypium laxum]|uniref:Uncharacterized protein n=1 Tax=Gossypium laxum TaxID=34288 RepID=A0A7J8Z2G1_9ROSI|nr:hypothetical protein [Gossypium laxum]
MPKSTEPKDGSESGTDLFKIYTFFLFRPYLANPIYHLSNVIVLMKRSLRPLISILMLVALAATLSYQIVDPYRDVFTISVKLESTRVLINPHKPKFLTPLYSSLHLLILVKQNPSLK